MTIDWFQAITFPRNTEVAFDLALEKIRQYNNEVYEGKDPWGLGVIYHMVGDSEPSYIMMNDGTGDFHNPRVFKKRKENSSSKL